MLRKYHTGIIGIITYKIGDHAKYGKKIVNLVEY